MFLIVLKDGEMWFEEYYFGIMVEDCCIFWLVVKSYFLVFFGVVLVEGVIVFLDDLVVKYVFEFLDSVYKDVIVCNVLNMVSGVEFDEDYLDFNLDINCMGCVFVLG